MTLYAYIMASFALIDLHSRLWIDDPYQGTKKAIRQTPRMLAYLNEFFPGSPTAHAVAVQLWRHTLMHTSRPRPIVDSSSNRAFSYLLHWSTEQLSVEQQFELESGDKLNLCLELLLMNIADAFGELRRAAENDSVALSRASIAWQGIVSQRFNLAAV